MYILNQGEKVTKVNKKIYKVSLPVSIRTH